MMDKETRFTQAKRVFIDFNDRIERKIKINPIHDWWIIVILFITIYLVISEISSQDCRDQVCINHTKEAKSNNSITENIDLTIETLRREHTLVSWRRAVIASFIVILVVTFIITKRWPSGYDFFILFTIIFTIIYFSIVWFQTNWWRRNNDKVEDHLLILRRRARRRRMQMEKMKRGFKV